jgi:hypothetical protein
MASATSSRGIIRVHEWLEVINLPFAMRDDYIV